MTSGAVSATIDLDGPVNLRASLECGQAFRWRRVDASTVRWPADVDRPDKALPGVPIVYKGVVQVKGLPVALFAGQDAPVTSTIRAVWESRMASGSDIEAAVRRYFSSDDDVGAIERSLRATDPVMADAVPFSSGLRLLNQDPWECLASYVLSINNSIPNIARSVEYLARCFGADAGLGEAGFPAPRDLAAQDCATIRQSKCGFRDRNLKDAAEKVAGGEIDLAAIAQMPTGQARESLMTIRGVGPKVADCVLLFGFHRLEVFPVDVWIARAMSQLYLGGRPVTPRVAREEGMRRFGALAGYAQEYLFYKVRNAKP